MSRSNSRKTCGRSLQNDLPCILSSTVYSYFPKVWERSRPPDGLCTVKSLSIVRSKLASELDLHQTRNCQPAIRASIIRGFHEGTGGQKNAEERTLTGLVFSPMRRMFRLAPSRPAFTFSG